MNSVVTTTAWLLLLAIIVALIARRLRLPYTVGLVVAGAALAFTRAGADLSLTHDFIFDVVLPPLLFEAAINIHWEALRRDLPLILTLALPGTLIAAAVTACGVRLVLHWPWPAALLFGSLIAATDPVAVIAMFKDYKLQGRLRLLVESESLFNDGVAAVLFTLMFAWALAPAAPGPTDVLRTLVTEVGGGILTGALVGGGVLLIAGRSTDHLLEATLTTIGAYGAFLLAQSFGGSGVLATVTAGLIIGNLGILAETRAALSGREFVVGLWEFFAFIANSLVFLGIGLTAAHLHFMTIGAVGLAIIVGLVLLGRAATVYPICLAFARTHWRVSPIAQHCLWWGGLRGALGLALALSIPSSLPGRDELLTATIAIVAFSVVAQGVTMKFLIRRLSHG